MKLVPLHSFPFLHQLEARRYRVFAGAAVSTAQIELRFRIESPSAKHFSEIIFPEVSTKPKRKDELWKNTCFECFIPGHGTQSYLEFNGSPSGDWNWYSFQKYREGMKPVSLTSKIEPKAISRTQSEKNLEVIWSLPMSGVLQGFTAYGENVPHYDPFGLTVVLQTQNATTYWALRHDGIKPDFHTRASFTYDPVRN